MDHEAGSFLRRAIELGRRGWGRVHPNPLVGCVLVRDGRIVGEGWHREYGAAHAEVMALSEAGERARGAEAYVSLEPCRHEGKTPPCTRALVEAGVARVAFGARDPGEVSGGGAAELAAQGIAVEGPLLTDREARWENPGFFHERADRPWIALKLAMSLDARIAAAEGVPTKLSGPEATREVHRLRSGFDGILVGSGTALVDDPRLTVRGPVHPRVPPRRILLDAAGRISSAARIFQERDGEVWILTTPASRGRWRDGIERVGAHIVEVAGGDIGEVMLTEALAALRKDGIRTLLCEGGGVLGSALLREGWVDRLILVMAPGFLGEEGVPAFRGLGGTDPTSGGDTDRRILRGWAPGEDPRRIGRDVWLALEPVEEGGA